jgi:hypothetical protein
MRRLDILCQRPKPHRVHHNPIMGNGHSLRPLVLGVLPVSGMVAGAADRGRRASTSGSSLQLCANKRLGHCPFWRHFGKFRPAEPNAANYFGLLAKAGSVNHAC